MEQLKDGDRNCLVVRDPLPHLGMVGDKLPPDGIGSLVVRCAEIVVWMLTGAKSDELLC